MLIYQSSSLSRPLTPCRAWQSGGQDTQMLTSPLPHERATSRGQLCARQRRAWDLHGVHCVLHSSCCTVTMESIWLTLAAEEGGDHAESLSGLWLWDHSGRDVQSRRGLVEHARQDAWGKSGRLP